MKVVVCEAHSMSFGVTLLDRGKNFVRVFAFIEAEGRSLDQTVVKIGNGGERAPRVHRERQSIVDYRPATQPAYPWLWRWYGANLGQQTGELADDTCCLFCCHVSKYGVKTVARHLCHNQKKMVLFELNVVDDGRNRNCRMLGDIRKNLGLISILSMLYEQSKWKCDAHDFEARAFHFMPETNALVVREESKKPQKNAMKQRHHICNACVIDAARELSK